MWTNVCGKCRGKGWYEVGRTSPSHYDGIEYCDCRKGVWYANASQEDRDLYHLHSSLNWQASGMELKAYHLEQAKCVAFAIASGEVELPFDQQYAEDQLSVPDDLPAILEIVDKYHNFTQLACNYAEQTKPLVFPGYAFQD